MRHKFVTTLVAAGAVASLIACNTVSPPTPTPDPNLEATVSAMHRQIGDLTRASTRNYNAFVDLAEANSQNSNAVKANSQGIEALATAVSVQQSQLTEVQKKVYSASTPVPTGAPTPQPTATAPPSPTQTKPIPQPSVPASPSISGEGYSIQATQRYDNGKIVTRLVVEWHKNPKCDKLNSEYGNEAGPLFTSNVRRVMSEYPRNGVSVNGFTRGQGQTNYLIPRDLWLSNVIFWNDIPFVRESTEDLETLGRMGRDVYNNACNDPASATFKAPNASLHQQLNKHMYSRNGTLRPQYAPGRLS